MGFVLSLFKKEENYEKVLEQIDQQIQKLQLRLKQYQVNHRTNVIRLLIVTLIFEISYLVYWKFFLHVPTPLENYLWASPLFLALLLAYVLKRVINQYYAYRSTNDSLKLEELQKQQEEKLEEYKAKINFSHVENVINRFDRRKSALPNIPPNLGTPTRPGPGPNTPTRPGPNPQMPHPSNPAQQPHPQQPQPQPQPQLPQIRPQIPGTSPSPANPAPVPHVPGPIMGPKVPAGIVFAPGQVTSSTEDNKERGMMDKLLDFFVGDSPSKSFALICKKCKAHNGLAPIEEMDSIQFICGACGNLNDFRKEQPNKPTTATNTTTTTTPNNNTNSNNNNNNTNGSNDNNASTASSASSEVKKEK
jgi:hypothetical protein